MASGFLWSEWEWNCSCVIVVWQWIRTQLLTVANVEQINAEQSILSDLQPGPESRAQCGRVLMTPVYESVSLFCIVCADNVHLIAPVEY